LSAVQHLASVIILNHNGSQILDVIRASVAAVLAQDYPAIELIIVDDNSSDGSDEVLAELCREVGATFASTRGGPHGICAARNRAIESARGAYLAFLDNDAVPQAGWLAALVRFMEAHPTLGACASRVMFADRPDVVNSMGSMLNELFHGNGVCIHQLYDYAHCPDEVMYATGNGMMLRREAINQVGPFDEGLLFYTPDDADYGMRLRRAGWRIAPVPDAVVYHMHSFSKTLQGMSFWDGRNRVYLALKHLSWRELPRFLIEDVRHNAAFTRLRDYARCWWSTLTHRDGLRGLLAYRRRHRGEPGYREAFAEWFVPPRRLMVVPDNRAYGREMRPLRELHAGEADEAYLYHGWYWPEQYAGQRLRWATRVASLVGVLPDGASALHWGFVAAPGADGASLRIHTQRRDQGTWADAGTFACRIPAAVEAAPVAVRMPCALEPAEYRFILEADSEPVGPGYFPRQISFGLTSLSVEPRSAEGS
jgi:GT2 family glycosyltransferase